MLKTSGVSHEVITSSESYNIKMLDDLSLERVFLCPGVEFVSEELLKKRQTIQRTRDTYYFERRESKLFTRSAKCQEVCSRLTLSHFLKALIKIDALLIRSSCRIRVR